MEINDISKRKIKDKLIDLGKSFPPSANKEELFELYKEALNIHETGKTEEIGIENLENTTQKGSVVPVVNIIIGKTIYKAGVPLSNATVQMLQGKNFGKRLKTL